MSETLLEYCKDKTFCCECGGSGIEKAWDHQQAKIDALEKIVQELFQIVDVDYYWETRDKLELEFEKLKTFDLLKNKETE